MRQHLERGNAMRGWLKLPLANPEILLEDSPEIREVKRITERDKIVARGMRNGYQVQTVSCYFKEVCYSFRYHDYRYDWHELGIMRASRTDELLIRDDAYRDRARALAIEIGKAIGKRM